MKEIKRRKIDAYSIVEMLVTMAIFGIIIIMVLQSLFLNIKLTTQINLRSSFNTEVDQLVSLIERDIRNADYYFLNDDLSNTFIRGCGSNPFSSDCTVSSNDIKIKWYLTPAFPPTPPLGTIGIVKRDKQTSTMPYVVTNDFITSSSILNVTQFDFYINSSEDLDTQAKLANILVTIKVKPAISTWTTTYGITEQVRQISVSTRTYEVKF